MSKSKTNKALSSSETRSYPFDRHSWRFLDYGSLEESLIVEVKKESVLYDKTSSAYRKAEATEDAWKRVSDALGVSVDSCKKRWKSLRDCYIKHYRAGLMSSSNQSQQQANKKSWAYFDHLSFLSKHIQLYRVGDAEYYKSESDLASQGDSATESTNQNRGRTETDEASSEANFDENQAEYIHIDEYDELSERAEYSHVDESHAKSMHPTSCYMAREQQQQQQQHDHRQQEGSLDSSSNSDERFLLSCVPALQRLSKRKNALVRLKIQQLLYEVEFGDEDEPGKDLIEKKRRVD